MIAAKNLTELQQALLDKFLAATAEANNVSVEEIKVSAAQNFAAFWNSFWQWTKKQNGNGKKAPESAPQSEQAQDSSTSAQEETSASNTQVSNGKLAERKFKEIMETMKKSPADAQVMAEEYSKILTPDQHKEINQALDKALAGI